MAGLGLINGLKACDHCQGHRQVRHNRHFVDPVTRYHTQNIERKNGEFKVFMREKKRIHDNQLLSHIAEFLWRERFDHRNGEDVFYNFWSQVAVIYPCTM
uniref:Uncharacterized protein n=1 Tax=Acrobeloides nanus TaxID=290746 RepID=A0A914EAS2_9BILA